MRRSILTIAAAVTALAFCAAALSPVEARKRGKNKHYGASKTKTLTIRKRSFLDSGRVPLYGAENRYVTMDTVHGRLPTHHQGDRYGAGVLPGPFGIYGPR